MIIFKALATAILLGLAGLLIGPLVALALATFPEGACGMYWLIPASTGAAAGLTIGVIVGFLLGLVA
ncbi:MAG: hypothetical protein ACRDJ9_34295 [Dehalococcoidia bacterium]